MTRRLDDLQASMTSMTLEEAKAKLAAMPEAERKKVIKDAMKPTAKMAWIPSPGPQTQAYFSRADILLYGGEPGGGKTSLGIGLSLTAHTNSLIMRRQYTDLGHITEELLRFNGTRDGFNGQSPPKLKRKDGRMIDLGAAANIGDEQHWMGHPHDLIFIDEATQFAKSQIRFLMGWLRSTDPKQRKRVVLGTNPPLAAEGLWVIEMFAPWIDDKFPNPAKPGELRYVVSDEDGNDKWVDEPDPVMIAGRMVTPLSRTYIPSSVKDNPFLMETDYDKQLQNMEEPFRSLLLGGFKNTLKDQPNQVIPTSWIKDAQKRWKPRPPEGIPMCAMSADMSGGGEDPMMIASRYDAWFSELIEIKGKDIPRDRMGPFCAGQIVSYRRDNCPVTVDLGGGYGGSTHDHLIQNAVEVKGYKGTEKTSRKSKSGNYKFTNKRSAAYWLFREALDPGQPGGSKIALPASNKLLADLSAPTFDITARGLQVEPKDEVCKKLGRSTDSGDTVVMCWWEGAKESNSAMEWIDRKMNNFPKVIMGRHHTR